MNKAGGNMYPWIDYTYNPLAGKCPNNCSYCYMKRPPVSWSKKYQGPQKVYEREMKVNLHNLSIHRRVNLEFVPRDIPIIFVCSGNDLGVAPREAKLRILRKCREEERNFYLFQSKDPLGFKEVEDEFPLNTIIGTTIETNRASLCRAFSNAPEPLERVRGMTLLKNGKFQMVSVEPKMDCDSPILNSYIEAIAPNFVSIGADSGKNNLPEPSSDTIHDLIRRLERHTLVFTKSNLERLMERN